MAQRFDSNAHFSGSGRPLQATVVVVDECVVVVLVKVVDVAVLVVTVRVVVVVEVPVVVEVVTQLSHNTGHAFRRAAVAGSAISGPQRVESRSLHSRSSN